MSTVPYISTLPHTFLEIQQQQQTATLKQSCLSKKFQMTSIFSRRRVHQYGKVFFIGLLFHWVGRGYWSFLQERILTGTRLTEMMTKSQQQDGFSLDILREQRIQHQNHNQEETSRSAHSRRILVVGLIQSLEQLTENKAVILSLQELCNLYEGGVSSNNEQNDMNNGDKVHVRIVYQHDAGDAADIMNNRLQSQLHQAGCHRVDLVSETQLFDSSDEGTNYWKQRFLDMNRFERLAVLRSLQRQQIIVPFATSKPSRSLSSFNGSNYNNTTTQHQLHGGDYYNIIVNFDADILQFPPLAALSQAIETAASANTRNKLGSASDDRRGGVIVCANGYEQWTLPLLSTTFDVYYDTFASVNQAGEWLFAEYVQAWWRILTFPQAMLFFDIIDSIRSHPLSSSSPSFPSFGQLWPMQSCFGGMAVYDYETWSNEMCDYDRNTIRLSVKSNEHNDEKSSSSQEERRWTLSPSYTVDGTISGDACEHVVFQQCLLAASQQREQRREQQQQQQQLPGKNSHNINSNMVLMIGIQPNLFVGRTADTSLLTFVVHIILLVLTTSAVAALAMVHRNRREKPLQLKQRWSL